MATNRLGTNPESAKSEAAAAPAPATPPPAPSAGGVKSWIPLLAVVVAMPVLAYVTTTFIVLPKLKAQMGAPAETAAAEGSKGGHGGGAHGKEGAASKTRFSVPLNKMIVNVAGTMGTRYLLTSVTLVTDSTDGKAKIEDSREQLLDLATSTLSVKTIADLEKPGARNQLRSELLLAFNSALGEGIVREIYFTELAIQ